MKIVNMERVQQNGGRAAYLMYVTEIAARHHNSCFDFDEKCCLYKAIGHAYRLTVPILTNEKGSHSRLF